MDQAGYMSDGSEGEDLIAGPEVEEAVEDLEEPGPDMPPLEDVDLFYEPLPELPDQEQALGPITAPPSPQFGAVDPDPRLPVIRAPETTSYAVPITAAFVFFIIASQLD